MAINPFEEPARKFLRSMEEHLRHLRAVTENVAQHDIPEIEQLRKEMDALRREFERAAQGIPALNAARRYRERFGDWPSSRRRRPRPDDFEGGEPVPVKPRPKPTPLMDGAEAPID